MEYIPKVTLKLSRLDNVLEEMTGKGKDKVKGSGGIGTAAAAAATGTVVAAQRWRSLQSTTPPF